ncbi:MAG: YvcK family protein [Candidatus Nomurabacteria bacterium]|nr:MAG: YvcK family protein [Candidatus Nomurabacteria bacterium]
MKKKNVVVIGGGTGTHTVLQGLKQHHDRINISAVVTMADSGGSTGRLRDEFGYLPVGDVRMALVALASEVDEHEELLRKLFMHRFERGGDLSGHNFGNLFLVALTDILGSEEEAIKVAGKLLRVMGTVVPVTTEKINLVATYDDGVVVVGEHDIDEPVKNRVNNSIVNISVTPRATISDSAKKVITEADLLVLGPGDLYTSVLANCVVAGVREAIGKSSAKVVYVSNLMTKNGQTSGMGVKEHVSEIVKYTSREIDYLVVNNTFLPENLLKNYARSQEFPVLMNVDPQRVSFKVIATDLLSSAKVEKVNGDVLRRSLIRHDPKKLASVLLDIVCH